MLAYGRMPILLRLIATTFVFLLFAGPASSQQPPQHGGTQLGLAQQKIKRVIVIYEENWSLDSLYAYYRDPNGARNATTGTQLQCPMGGTADDAPLTANPP